MVDKCLQVMQKQYVTFMSRKTDICVKRDLYLWQKRPTSMSKRTYTDVKRQKESHIYVKRDLHLYQKTHVLMYKEKKTAAFMSKETYIHIQRVVCICIYICIYTCTEVSTAVDILLFG